MSSLASKISISAQEILAPVKTQLEVLNKRLVEDISSDSGVLKSVMQNIFAAGGKRIRPAISFLVFGALQGGTEEINETVKEKLFLVAEIAELIHTASLVHDDIIDNAKLRRGKETANSTWDNAISVISGDFMFAKAAVNLGKLDTNEIVCLYAKVLEELCDGEIEQAERKYQARVDWDFYLRKTYKKTASLIEASAKAPAVLLRSSGAVDRESIDAIAAYGKNLGMAFQIVDDILDFTSDEKTLGKPAGSDLKEGHLTAPSLFYLEEIQSDKDKFSKFEASLNSFMAASKFASLEAELDSEIQSTLLNLLEDMKASSAIERAQAKAQEYANFALENLQVLKNSEFKKSLEDMVQFVLARLS